MDEKRCALIPTRRQFIQQFGMLLASFVIARCTPTPPGSERHSPRDRLRSCWMGFHWLAEQARDENNQGTQVQDELIANHRSALDDLVADGELSSDAARQIQIAYKAAVQLIWNDNRHQYVECYEPIIMSVTPTPLPIDEAAKRQLTGYIQESRNRIYRQATLLAEMAESDDINQSAVARTAAVIERDMVLMTLSKAQVEELRGEMIEASYGGAYEFPSLDKLDLEIPPETAEAARFLVELLLED